MEAVAVLEPAIHASLPRARGVLRAATCEVHDRMHHHPALSQLAAGTIARDDYRRLLARSYGFYAMVEPILGLAGGLTALLALDLAELGMDAADVAALPRCAPLPLGDDSAETTGARYVVLGASLGGKVMARAIAGEDCRGQRLPVHFLTGIDAGDWTRFAGRLDADLPDAAAQARAATAAAATFSAYENWMAE